VIIIFFLMWWCMLRMTFSPSNWHYKIFKLSYTRLFIFRPTFWKSCGIIISSLACFLINYLHMQSFATLIVDVLLNTMQTCFQSHTCLIAVTWLLTHPITPMFCLSLVHFYNITYLPWLATSYNCTIFHVVNVNIPLIILVSTCFSACVTMNTL
jgi:hypothetical protein